MAQTPRDPDKDTRRRLSVRGSFRHIFSKSKPEPTASVPQGPYVPKHAARDHERTTNPKSLTERHEERTKMREGLAQLEREHDGRDSMAPKHQRIDSGVADIGAVLPVSTAPVAATVEEEDPSLDVDNRNPFRDSGLGEEELTASKHASSTVNRESLANARIPE